MEITEIEKLMEILNASDITEIEYKKDTDKIFLKKGCSNNDVFETEKLCENEETKEDNAEKKKSRRETDLISLNVGKFFYRDNLGKEMIKIGQKVEEGQLVGYIRAIGIKTSVKSDKDGIVKDILIKNGGIVEFGQSIITLEKDVKGAEDV